MEPSDDLDLAPPRLSYGERFWGWLIVTVVVACAVGLLFGVAVRTATAAPAAERGRLGSVCAGGYAAGLDAPADCDPGRNR